MDSTRIQAGVLLVLFSIATMLYGELMNYAHSIGLLPTIAYVISLVGLLVGVTGFRSQ